jgi:RNA-directed DNA polymerase
VLKLIERFLKQGVMEDLVTRKPSTGTPQGGVISPLLSNIYLDELDHLMARNGQEMVRYADDLVILCRTEDEAQNALKELQRWTASAGLTLHPTKTRIVDAATDGFEFLGYRFERGIKFPRDKSLMKLRDAIRSKTPRMNGRSLQCIIADVNRTMRGWFEYFKHAHRNTFGNIDGWVRMRLRSILRKRRGRKGRAHGRDHHRWPNKFFADHGLFTLKQAHERLLKSVRTQTC